MARVSVETRRRRVIFRTFRYSVKSIQKRLLEENIVISRWSLCKLLKKYVATGTVGDLPKKQKRILSEEHLRFIDHRIQENDELTSRIVRNELLDKWPKLLVSIRTVRRARWSLGWRSTCPK